MTLASFYEYSKMCDIEIQEVRLLSIKLLDMYCYVGVYIAMLWVVL